MLRCGLLRGPNIFAPFSCAEQISLFSCSLSLFSLGKKKLNSSWLAVSCSFAALSFTFLSQEQEATDFNRTFSLQTLASP